MKAAPQSVGLVPSEFIAQRLALLAPLDDVSLQVLRQLVEVHALGCGAELVGERATLCKPLFLLSGWAARLRSLADGRRQIIGFVLPGDGVRLARRPHPLAAGTVVALTPVKVVDASAPARALRADTPASLMDALHLAACLEERNLIDQVLRLGRLTAYERLCHLLLEFHTRLRLAGLVQRDRFPLPLTQETLADASGLSNVHVNRVLQELRRDRLIELHGGMAVLLDRPRMAHLCDYVEPEPSRWLADRVQPSDGKSPQLNMGE